MEKAWFYEIIAMVKDKKMPYKSCNVNQILCITGITLHGQE